jgi:hypothetical protein
MLVAVIVSRGFCDHSRDGDAGRDPVQPLWVLDVIPQRSIAAGGLR